MRYQPHDADCGIAVPWAIRVGLLEQSQFQDQEPEANLSRPQRGFASDVRPEEEEVQDEESPARASAWPLAPRREVSARVAAPRSPTSCAVVRLVQGVSRRRRLTSPASPHDHAAHRPRRHGRDKAPGEIVAGSREAAENGLSLSSSSVERRPLAIPTDPGHRRVGSHRNGPMTLVPRCGARRLLARAAAEPCATARPPPWFRPGTPAPRGERLLRMEGSKEWPVRPSPPRYPCGLDPTVLPTRGPTPSASPVARPVRADGVGVLPEALRDRRAEGRLLSIGGEATKGPRS